YLIHNYLIHRFEAGKKAGESPQYDKQPFRSEAEAMMRARSLIEAGEGGNFIVEDQEGRVLATDAEIRIPILRGVAGASITTARGGARRDPQNFRKGRAQSRREQDEKAAEETPPALDDDIHNKLVEDRIDDGLG